MDLLTNTFHILGTGAAAYFLANQIRDPLTRPNILATFYLLESSSVPYLEGIKERAKREKKQWLVAHLENHIKAEKRHSHFFSQALKKLNKQVIDINNIPKEEKKNSFFEAFFQGYSLESLHPDWIDWITFAGSTYILELDSSKDYARMANVLPEPENVPEDSTLPLLKKGLLNVARDEASHAAYLYETLQRRLPQVEVDAIIEQWRIRKVKAIWDVGLNKIRSGKNDKSFSLVTESIQK
jgi:rubrerythrin